jgi:uncharacterized protein YceK
MHKLSIVLFVICLVLTGCGQATPDTNAINTAIAETAAAGQSGIMPTDTLAPSLKATDLPPTPIELPPTETPIPTITPTSGPIFVEDDFSTDSGIWSGCEECEWKDGALFMGPYPASNFGDAYYAICEPCGMTSNYRMAVDATFFEGASDRGFGFLVYLTDDYYVTFEMATWQVAGLFKYEPVQGRWSELLPWQLKGYINPGRQMNHIEIIVRDSQSLGKSDITIKINDKVLAVYSGIGIEPTLVGLEVGWHSIGVAFDNFEFEELEP